MLHKCVNFGALARKFPTLTLCHARLYDRRDLENNFVISTIATGSKRHTSAATQSAGVGVTVLSTSISGGKVTASTCNMIMIPTAAKMNGLLKNR